MIGNLIVLTFMNNISGIRFCGANQCVQCEAFFGQSNGSSAAKTAMFVDGYGIKLSHLEFSINEALIKSQ